MKVFWNILLIKLLIFRPSNRRNEKKEKTGSDTFSFSGLFKGRSKSRPALDLSNVITNLESRASGNGPGQMVSPLIR